METERYFDSLKEKIKELFVMIHHGHAVPAEQRRYVEGFMHASLDLQIATRQDLEALMESVNQEVFGMSIEERRKRYPEHGLSSGTALETPTYQRRGVKIDLGDEEGNAN